MSATLPYCLTIASKTAITAIPAKRPDCEPDFSDFFWYVFTSSFFSFFFLFVLRIQATLFYVLFSRFKDMSNVAMKIWR